MTEQMDNNYQMISSYTLPCIKYAQQYYGRAGCIMNKENCNHVWGSDRGLVRSLKTWSSMHASIFEIPWITNAILFIKKLTSAWEKLK